MTSTLCIEPLTVVIPCYNPDPAHLNEAVESALASTLPPAAVLLIDDGTTDPAAQAALRVWATRPGVQVIAHGENRGLSAARNTGMAAARTDLVLQLDADDRVDPTFAEKAAWALAGHPEWSFVNAWVRVFGASEYVWTRGFEAGRDFLADNQTNPIAVIRRSIDRAIGGHTESIRDGLEDWDYWLKMASHGHWGGTIHEVLIDYRTHPQPTHWPNRDNPDQRQRFLRGLRERYGNLWRERFPQPTPRPMAVPQSVVCASQSPGQPGERRVLLIAPWLTLGGADRFNLNLTEQITRRGGHVTIATTVDSPDPWRAAFAAHTADIFSLPKFLTPELQPVFLRNLITTRGIDVVIVTNAMLGYAALPYLRAHCPQTTFVDYNHMVVSEWLNGGFVRIGVENQMHLDLNLVSSRQVKEWMVSQGAQADRVEVVYTGQDPAALDPTRFDRATARATLGLDPDTPVLLFPARLEPQKRPRLLLQILARLSRNGRRFVCLIAGDGPQRSLVEAEVRRLKLSRHVRLLGAMPAEAMPQLYAAADILVLPSENEGISLAIYEGMTMGLPVVAAAVGGQRELVTDREGVLVAPGPRELEHYVAALDGLITDPQRRQELGAAARQRIVAGFTLDQMTDRLLAAFRQAEALNRDAQRPRLGHGPAQDLAERVADDLRHERLQERLRAGSIDLAHEHAVASGRWRGWVYQAKKRFFRPAYYWAIQNGFDFVIPMVGRLYRRLNWLLK